MHVSFSSRFEKQYKKLPKDLQQKVRNRVTLLTQESSNSLLGNHPLKDQYAGCRSINITGDYRAIFELYPNLLHFIAVGTHGELYGR